jgi:beta-glucosidase
VTFRLGPEDLWLLDREMRWAVEAGRFEVMVGESSLDIRLRGGFDVTETATFGSPPAGY